MVIGGAIAPRSQPGTRWLDSVLCGPSRLCVLCVRKFARTPSSNVWISSLRERR